MKTMAGFGLRVATRSLFATVLILSAALSATGQEGPDGGAAVSTPTHPLQPQEFGAGANVTIIGAPAFHPRADGVPGYAPLGYIHWAGGTDSTFWAPVSLPNGALLTDLCVWYYNTSVSGIVAEWGAYGLGVTTQPPIYEEFAQFSLAPAGGYNTACIVPNTIIRNLGDLNGDAMSEWATYRVAVGFTVSDDTQRIGGAFLRWNRQVSPAPGGATFNDVPVDDPAFQFIEAFSRAGITAGCSVAPPLYCPDATVTRRQMAVFFAIALGLHWPD